MKDFAKSIVCNTKAEVAKVGNAYQYAGSIPIEKIPDNWRPEFPKAGYVVYYAPNKAKWFATEAEAKKFAAKVGNGIDVPPVTPAQKPGTKPQDKPGNNPKKPNEKEPEKPFSKYIEEAQKNGNSTEKLFYGLKDDAEKEEEKSDEALDELEKTGNRLDWSENLVGKHVWVKSKGDEWKCYVLQDKGDKVYIQDTDGHMGWVSKERITGKVNNKRVGNVASEYEILKQDPSKMHPMYKKAYEEAMKKLAREDEEFKKRFEKEYGVKAKNEASDDKFAYVMREFDEGKLKTPDGKVVTDPAQAKAIAYSESKKTENGLARARNAMKCGNSQITLWKGNDSALVSDDGLVQYLENNAFETDRDKYDSQQTAIEELKKLGYRKK